MEDSCTDTALVKKQQKENFSHWNNKYQGNQQKYFTTLQSIKIVKYIKCDTSQEKTLSHMQNKLLPLSSCGFKLLQTFPGKYMLSNRLY